MQIHTGTCAVGSHFPNSSYRNSSNVPFDPVAPCTTIPGSPFSPFVPEGPAGPWSPSRPSLPSLPCCCSSKGTLPHSVEVVFTVGGATVKSALPSALGSTVASQRDNKEWHNRNHILVFFQAEVEQLIMLINLHYDVNYFYDTNIVSKCFRIHLHTC